MDELNNNMKKNPFKDLNEFLIKHKTESGETPTHTRIPDKKLGIYGGSWRIHKEELPTFHRLYVEHVFVKNKPEYLTEKQQESGQGPLLIDLDFKYKYDVCKRQHKKENVDEIIGWYLEQLKEFYIFEESKPFPIYVMEKPDVNRLQDESLTKDGIHIYIGIQINYTLQLMLREKMLTILPEVLQELPLINSWDAILDESISRGTTNWQLFGSKKPGNQRYELTYHYDVTIDPVDGQFIMEPKRVSDFDIIADFRKLSAQYEDNVRFEMTPSMKAECEKRYNTQKAPRSKPKTKLMILSQDDDDDDNKIYYERITSKEMLKKTVTKFLDNLKSREYEIKEIYEYTQILPEKYYEPGSHLANRFVAFALKHLSLRMDNDNVFLIWVALRAKASDFDYGTIADLYKSWCKHFKERVNGYTERSIIYWAKQDAPEEYMLVKKNTINYYIELTMELATDHDLAMVLHQMYKDKYVCSSRKHKTWYKFCDHHWKEDPNTTLRMEVATKMNEVYQEKIEKLSHDLQEQDASGDLYEKINAKIRKVTDISGKIRFGSCIDNIMKEAMGLFCDENFNIMRDSNKHLMCFSNGVIDFNKNEFREGYPQDYITKTTGIPYVDFNPERHGQISDEIMTFMEQLFPIKELNRYMWDHLASVLVGENINQTFNIYRGSGSNGKSMLADLMSHALGQYKGSVPITLVTGKRNAIGGTSSEVIQLKGVRYAVMQEPSKGDRLNEGPMKELTGGDPITARALYSEAETFTPQFCLVVCTNNLPEIGSNDDGTWRRIRICDFVSKFVDADVVPNQDSCGDDEEKKYVFPKDKKLKIKIPMWAPVFMSMLVKRVFETKGHVEDCEMVLSSSNKYRRGQDHISAFVIEMVGKKEGKKIGKQELTEQFKLWFQTQQGSRILPKGCGEELSLYMDKKFGKKRKDGWYGVEILYADATDEIQELAS